MIDLRRLQLDLHLFKSNPNRFAADWIWFFTKLIDWIKNLWLNDSTQIVMISYSPFWLVESNSLAGWLTGWMTHWLINWPVPLALEPPMFGHSKSSAKLAHLTENIYLRWKIKAREKEKGKMRKNKTKPRDGLYGKNEFLYSFIHFYLYSNQFPLIFFPILFFLASFGFYLWPSRENGTHCRLHRLRNH